MPARRGLWRRHLLTSGEDLDAFIAAAAGDQPRNRGIATPSKENLVDMGNPGLHTISLDYD